ncbi:MAG: sodium:solute symporter family protein [Bacteroidetes bacterium]|nr:sodium:solute symporter family protein [Bacteroidota bacterium]
MGFIDVLIFSVYMIAMLAVGFFYHRKNNETDDYYVGGRNMGAWHIGLSVVATDVGGGFSIGLGGLGFAIGISGSWMLFTGLLGAWLAAVVLIPRVKGNPAFGTFQTFPQLFRHFFGPKTALIAGIISLIGYIGFTSSQLLAGAKLAAAALDGFSMHQALWVMGAVAVTYTVLGGLKAVIYTDTIQWIILLSGLIGIAIPMAWMAVGGWGAIEKTLDPEMLSLTNITWQEIVYWAFTIIPIWFVGMTLYQRIYASRDVKTAKKAWFIAGLLEWPIMAFMGVLLGMLARVAVMEGLMQAGGSAMDPELGLPMLLKEILPAGLMGLVLASYFSAILSTADSCLMAASGNLSTDVLHRWTKKLSVKRQLSNSQIFTLIIGLVSLALATTATEVLDLMLYSYAFMVSGLFVPIIAALYTKSRNSIAAGTTMVVGGSTTILLQELVKAKKIELVWGLDPNIFGLAIAGLCYFIVSKLFPNVNKQNATY